MSFFWRELRSEYTSLPLFDPDPMSEDYWLENMIEDRLYVCYARNKSLLCLYLIASNDYVSLIVNPDQGHDHHIRNCVHQKRRQ